MIDLYIITNRISNKQYIGITSKGIINRFRKHVTNAAYGIDTYLYRAIRKYGINNFNIRLLSSTTTWDEAYCEEKRAIIEYNTLVPYGYNISTGGTGGDIINSLPDDKLQSYLQYRKEASTGRNNGNYSGYSDECIIDFATKYFQSLGYIGGQKVWANFAKKNGLPQTFSKNRFGGKYENFVNKIIVLTGLPYIKHKKSDTHKSSLKKSITGKIWVCNSLLSKQINKNELEKYLELGYKLGRKYD